LPAAYMIGDIIEFPEELEPYVSTLLEGGEIPALENNFMTGWMLSVFCPIERDAKATPCYVITEVSLEYMADYMKTFLLKVMLLLAGFFLLILACGMWISGFFMVYPINTIAECVDGFVKAGDDQAALDENVRRLRSLDIQTQDETEKLYHSLCTMAAGMAEQLRDIRHYTDSTAQMQNGLIITMADMVENRDSDTGAHIQKTAAYVRIILDGLKRKGYYLEKLTPKYMEDVVMSAPLHDVGKINIPDAILNKPGKLTDEEYEIMKTHTTVGRIIMEKAISTVRGENYLKEARNMAGYHHERWDGKGYPEGLHGEVIPLSARVMAVADVFDALTSPRVYKPAFPLEKALEIISDGSGTQFDPKCVEAFMDSLAEVKLILMKYQDM
ncbi:MAG: HD domain-containing protein, partial [Lachnospiraceae bacterium]|nr:HD domain-containing protein [Lachnospiraceae bacterium]